MDVGIANYPFTTIKPNSGIAYARRKCVDAELGVRCNARNSLCRNGNRFVPVGVVDVAGLVPGASLGKGMGNQFLSDLISSNALIQVVDATGRTDTEGNVSEGSDPANDVSMVIDEIGIWLRNIMLRNIGRKGKKTDGQAEIENLLLGFNIKKEVVQKALERNSVDLAKEGIDEGALLSFSRELLRLSKPLVVAANKIDAADEGSVDKIRGKLKGIDVIGCSAAIELALRKADASGIIEYVPGDRDFRIKGTTDKEKADALGYMRSFLARRGTGVQELIDHVTFRTMKKIVVYPVENEKEFTDHYGNVLPDALLLDEGSTVYDLASSIHTDIAKNMLYAIDAKRKIRISKTARLNDGDVIKIVSAAK